MDFDIKIIPFFISFGFILLGSFMYSNKDPGVLMIVPSSLWIVFQLSNQYDDFMNSTIGTMLIYPCKIHPVICAPIHACHLSVIAMLSGIVSLKDPDIHNNYYRCMLLDLNPFLNKDIYGNQFNDICDQDNSTLCDKFFRCVIK